VLLKIHPPVDLPHYHSGHPPSSDNHGLSSPEVLSESIEKPPDTVGQPPSTEIGVLNMSSLKAKKLRKPPQEKVLLEL
jgi:hypothetical protein